MFLALPRLGFKFGFLTYEGVQNDLNLVKRPNQIHIWDKNLHVNIPRFKNEMSSHDLSKEEIVV